MAYKLVITEKAENDLDSILTYIVDELCNSPAAAKLADEVEACYNRLAENPHLYGECQQSLLRKAHYRKAVIGNYLMSHRTDDEKEIVYVERYFSEIQDYASKL